MTSSYPYELRDTLVQVTDVSLCFTDDAGQPQPCLKPTSIAVRDIVRPGLVQGQIIGILGPSGIGKTQFSRILAGLQTPTTGTVLVNVHGTMTPVMPGLVGMVAQNYPLFPHRTVLGNLFLSLEHAALSTKEKRERIFGMLSYFDLEHKAQAYPEALSGGQRQRVAIIRELLCSEHYVVLDEPFTGLDPIAKDAVCALLDKVAKLSEENTLFVVAHDIAALAQICDRLWLFGRERDAQGKFLPGATIKMQYDLLERDLAWHPGITREPAFAAFLLEVREVFGNL